jgi:N-acetylmuramoyl-L-alanine amidase
MALNMNFNRFSNYDKKERLKKQIKIIVFHYTGMQSKVEAFKKLYNPQSKVSCHYFIDEIGNIIKIVPEKFLAWHAGKSGWKNFKFINKFSIGIELVNPGHDFGYRKFSKKQIHTLKKISKKLIAKYNIIGSNIVGHSDIAPLRKKDPGEKFPWKELANSKIGIWHNLKNKELKKNRRKKTNINEKRIFFKCINKIGYQTRYNLKKSVYENKIIKSFQRRFRTEYISGVIDKECLLIAKNLSFLMINKS